MTRDQNPFSEGRCHAQSGRLDLAHSLYVDAIRLCAERGVTTGSCGMSDVAPELLRKIGGCQRSAEAVPIEAWTLLAEDLVNAFCDFDQAEIALRRKAELQSEWQAKHCKTTGLYFGFDWLRNIGHIGMMGYYIKLRELGLLSQSEFVVVGSNAVNRDFLDCLRPYIAIRETPGRIAEWIEFTSGAGPRVFDLVEWPGQSPVLSGEALNVIEQLWGSRAPLATLSPDSKRRGDAILESAGIPTTADIICLHVRDSGFYGDKTEMQRNAAIGDYGPAIDIMTARGLTVIRMGGPEMRPVSQPGVFDYATSAIRSTEMDVYLCARCRFFIGTTSGLMYVPHTFGRPCLITNYCYLFGPPPLGKRSSFIAKQVLHNGRALSPADMTSKHWMRLSYRAKAFADAGGSYVDNTPDEIAEAVEGMISMSATIESLTRRDSRSKRPTIRAV